MAWDWFIISVCTEVRTLRGTAWCSLQRPFEELMKCFLGRCLRTGLVTLVWILMLGHRNHCFRLSWSCERVLQPPGSFQIKYGTEETKSTLFLVILLPGLNEHVLPGSQCPVSKMGGGENPVTREEPCAARALLSALVLREGGGPAVLGTELASHQCLLLVLS